MHKMILDATIAKVRQRASEGDCPITAPYSVEHLETALLMLADTVAVKAAEPVSRPAGEGEREAVARIIDPEAMNADPDQPPVVRRRVEERKAEAFAKADDILSLLSPAAPDAGQNAEGK